MAIYRDRRARPRRGWVDVGATGERWEVKCWLRRRNVASEARQRHRRNCVVMLATPKVMPPCRRSKTLAEAMPACLRVEASAQAMSAWWRGVAEPEATPTWRLGKAKPEATLTCQWGKASAQAMSAWWRGKAKPEVMPAWRLGETPSGALQSASARQSAT